MIYLEAVDLDKLKSVVNFSGKYISVVKQVLTMIKKGIISQRQQVLFEVLVLTRATKS